jgi:hypothetical protein
MKNNGKIITTLEEFKENLNISDVSDSFVKSLDNSGIGGSDNPNNYEPKTWDEIFLLQQRKDMANYSSLKNWLKKYYKVPTLK